MSQKQKIGFSFTGVFCLVSGLFASTVGFAGLINGAGATFPYPLYSKWIAEYEKIDPSTKINYQSIGSGGGVRQFLEKTVDFGASDAPMTEEQLSKAQPAAVHVPTVLGAVVVTYNLKGLTKPLQLSGATLAQIFLGKVTKWTDPQIAKENPGASIPSSDIIVVRRSDGSGTTGIFTDYLAKVSPEWKDKVGAGTAVNWPVGLGGKGNEGVSGLVKQTPGSIAYVELIYAKNNGLPVAAMRNKSGQFVAPSPKSVTAAATGALKTIPDDFRVSITDAEGKESYPISGFTYLLVYSSMEKSKGEPIVKFLRWVLKDGQKLAEPLEYAPLPRALVAKVEARVGKIEVK